MAKKKFIQAAIKKPGQLHRDLGVPQGEKIPAAKIAAAAKMGGKIGQRARFAETLMHMHSPDRFNETALGERPPRLEYHAAQEQKTARYPTATGTPDIQTNDPAGSPRASVKTMQAAAQSTPGSRKNSWPSNVDSFNDSET